MPANSATATATSSPTRSMTPEPSLTATPISEQTPTPALSPSVVPTSTATAQPPVTATATVSPGTSPTPTVVPCQGDCDGDGHVTVAELVLGIDIALGRNDEECSAFDTNRDGRIDIEELLGGVGSSLTSCATPAP